MSQKIELDDWQKEILREEGNICLCTGRQVGKSTVIAMRAGNYALENKNKNIMVIAAVERQALLLFEKILAYIYETKKGMIKTGLDRPTKHVLKLKNGSTIHCLPTGMTGYGIRGFTIDDLYADEAHFISEEVWSSVTPSLATTGGRINLLSTPDLSKGKDGYFYRSSMADDFKFMSISTSDVAEGRKEPQRSAMLKHIGDEKKRLSKSQFAAEYLGQFVDAMLQVFPNQWIEKVCCLEQTYTKRPGAILGVDIAGMGRDQTTYEALYRNDTHVLQCLHQVTTKTRTTEIEATILSLEKNWNFKQIGIDDGGMGVGVFDHLIREPTTKRKIIALNNASRSIQEDRQTKLLKEDMYFNLLAMGEVGELKLLDNDEIKASFRSIHMDEDKIVGQDSHIVEGLIRAAWLLREKKLNTWIHSFNL